LYADGGAIEITANDPNDTESRDQIRMHLSHIAVMFAAGNFQAPMLIYRPSAYWCSYPPALESGGELSV